jgi:hypothetical protein
VKIITNFWPESSTCKTHITFPPAGGENVCHVPYISMTICPYIIFLYGSVAKSDNPKSFNSTSLDWDIRVEKIN